MDNKLLKSYLNKIGELVIDEEKIVTYKFLSRTLGIHINTAKQLLHTYLSKQKSESSVPISATYLLAGKLVDGSFNITILNETDLKSTYSKYLEITSEHVYSIKKGENIKEINLLCGINKDVQNVGSSTIIKCLKSVIKPKNSNDKKAEESTNQTKTKSGEEKKKEAVNVKIESLVKKSPKKTSPTDNKSKVQNEKQMINTKKRAGNIAALFANAAQKNSDKSKNILKNKINSSNNDEKKNLIEEIVLKEKEVAEKDKTNKVEPKEKVKKKKGISKRKRIQLISDSEESNSDSDNEEPPPVEEEEIGELLPLSTIEEEKEEVNVDLPRNKRKKRKIVDKTVMDEDGYIETKKEVIFVTDSEDEVDNKAASSKKEGSEQKRCKLENVGEKTKISAQKTLKKQSSLLTFFKKN